MTSRHAFMLAVLAAVSSFSAPAFAQAYITMIVPFPAGGTYDATETDIPCHSNRGGDYENVVMQLRIYRCARSRSDQKQTRRPYDHTFPKALRGIREVETKN